MKTKNYYKSASFLASWLCFGMCAIFLVLFVDGCKSQSIPWALLVICIFVGGYGLIALIHTVRFRKECEKIKNNGIQYSGRIIDIRQKIKHKTDSGALSFAYYIEGYSTLQNCTIRFWTPFTTFVPQGKSIICMIYEYEGKYYADSFKNI